MKKQVLLLMLFALPLLLFSKGLTLDSCLQQAREQYPLVNQAGLIEKSAAFNLSNANKAWLPQLSFTARASYQSDVTKIPDVLGDMLSNLTGHPVSFESLSRDQYQLMLELQQTIWDGGLTAVRKQEIEARAGVEKQRLDVALYSLNERVQQLFFGILLIDGQLEQVRLLKGELDNNFAKVSAYLANGVAQASDLDLVKVEQLNVRQRESDLLAVRSAYLKVLSVFTGLALEEHTQLEQPPLPELKGPEYINRPELSLYAAEQTALEVQRAAIQAMNLPKIGMFARGAYANPGLNMFQPGFQPYYVAGIQLQWNLGGFYTRRNELEKINIGHESIEWQKATFLFNHSLLTTQQQQEIDQLKTTLVNHEEIVRLRSNIKQAAEVKFENGTITLTDLLREINAENLARQTAVLYEIQLYKALYQYQYQTNQ